MSSKNIQTIIQFFKECYESDNRETNINNLFSKKVSDLFPITPEQTQRIFEENFLLINKVDFLRITDKLAKYKREKKLIFGSNHITVNLKNSSGSKVRLCAPLVLYDLDVDTDYSSNSVKITFQKHQWNFPVLRELLNDSTDFETLDSFFENDNSFQLNNDKLIQWLKEKVSSVEFTNIEKGDIEILKSFSRKRTVNKATLLQVGLFAIVDRSINTRGILHELDLLINSSEYSVTIHQLLTGEYQPKLRIIQPDFHNLPSILSEAQEKILTNASAKNLSQVIGPPGTGKSYTIANIAIDRFLNGESVLIVSQNEHAINVIQKHLFSKLGNSAKGVVRAGSSHYHKSLKKYVADLLNNIKPKETTIKTIYDAKYLVFPKKDIQYEPNLELRLLKRKIVNLEKKYIIESTKAVDLGLKLDASKSLKSISKLLAEFHLWITDTNYDNPNPLYELIDKLQKLYAERENLVAQFINIKYQNRLNDLLQDADGRKVMLNFQSVLKAQNSSRQKARIEKTSYDSILKIFPIWLSSLEGLHKSLPLEKELFDVVIIDEATQCDISSCLPAIQRGKRAVIVGDPEQLRHISFLSRYRQEKIKEKFGLTNHELELNYRDESIIDITNHNLQSTEDVVMLDEHYRGLPRLIEFSNKHFYNNGLRIMTERPNVNNHPISVINVNGKHDKGKNQIEANQLIEYLKQLILSQEDLPIQHKSSIGILSFFRDQAELLQLKILEFSATDIANHHLRAGTPYAFQGEERDIMLISCCVDANSHWGSFQYLNWKNMFNVAITRAKMSQVLFLSANKDEMPSNNLLKKYIDFIELEQASNITHEIVETDCDYIKDLAAALKEKDVHLIKNYSLASVPMDLVAVYKNESIAIDLIGFPGEYEDAFHLYHYKIFDRAGFRIFPITLNEWLYKREQIINRLIKELNIKSIEKEDKLKTSSLTNKWPLLVEHNPQIVKEIQAIEFDLSNIDSDKVILQLDQLLKTYHQFIKTLINKLKEGEHTYARYKNAADNVLASSIENYRKIIALYESIPDLDNDHKNHPIAHLIKEQKILIEQLLAKNNNVIIALQKMTVSWGKINTNSVAIEFDFLFDELTSLNKQIKQYDK